MPSLFAEPGLEQGRPLKTSALFEYENPEAFKACQERIEAWRNTDAFQKEMGSLDAVIEATRNIIIQDLRRD